VAPAPWPATPIATSARRGDAWRFAAEDGTVYATEGFDGPLRVVAELPSPLVPAHTPGYHQLRGVHSREVLFAVDVHRRAYSVTFEGQVTRLDLARVVTGAFVDARTVLAITEPGVLQVSDDGGAHFRAVRPPSGLPLRVNVVDDDTFVTTTGGVFRWRREGMSPVDPPPAREAWVGTAAAARARVDALRGRGFRLPSEGRRVVAHADGTLTGVAGAELVTADPSGRGILRREAAPGAECSAYASGAGPRYVCRHDGWAQAVFAQGPTGWITLRDEARAEPMGPVVFDDRNAGWAVSAPCTQSPDRDPHLVCAYGPDGTRRTLRAPFPAEVVAMHDGAVLAMDTATSRAAGPTRAVIFRGNEAEALRLPLSAAGVRSVRWTGDRMVFWEPPGAAGQRLRCVTASQTREGLVWQTVDAPEGATRGLHGPQDTAIALGPDASRLWMRRGSGPFRAMPSPVQGAAEALPIPSEATAYCRGPWCRFGDDLALAFRAAPEARAIARSTPPGAPLPPRPREEQQRLVCRLGAAEPGPEMDHGIAATGYTLRWQVTGRSVTVTWAGDAFNAVVTGTLSARPNTRVLARAVPGARAPVGLLEQCNDIGCDHFLATRAGLFALSLGRAEPGGMEVFEREDGGYLLRFDTTLTGTRIVTLVQLDAAGVEGRRRDFVLVEDVADAHVGRFGVDDGLWVRDTAGALRFYPVVGDTAGTALATVPAPDRTTPLCAAEGAAAGTLGGTLRGTLRIRDRPAQVVGAGWFVEAGSWQQEELLELTAAGFCVRAIGGGESRDEDEAHAAGVEEHEPVRTFAVRAAGGETMTGRAWRGRERLALTCVQRPPPAEGEVSRESR